jgi:hypothetical protein
MLNCELQAMSDLAIVFKKHMLSYAEKVLLANLPKPPAGNYKQAINRMDR